ncbi:GntR family transcriptional regulator [Gibbsiella quercinecans]|uniref:GntR family transcriptional regulator n=1 Tax=Gibbsiella quercinecans TaxID=929813 RepID=UPI00242E0437|nr:GntR family transcriptional regulator [Gibbsiella quercinecans]
MTLVRENLTSLYRQIADTLQQEIAAGLYQPSGKLPSESALEQRFGVSRVTVRLALKSLTENGLVERKQGKGTYVSGKKVAHGIHIMRSFHESLKQQGLNATMRLLQRKTVATPDALRELLGENAALTFVARLHLVDDEPIAVGYSHFSVFTQELTWQQTEQETTWSLLEKSARQPILRSEIAIRLTYADKALAGILQINKGVPLFQMERISWFADNHCAEHTVFYIIPERYEFTWSNG